MQANKGTHCSFNEDLPNRIQCETCHEYERMEAADKANLYAKNKGLPPIDSDPLEVIANMCQSLTYGEMMTLGAGVFAALEEYEDTHDPNPMAKAIHKWSQNYGVDNSINNSSNPNPDITATINDLYTQDRKE